MSTHEFDEAQTALIEKICLGVWKEIEPKISNAFQSGLNKGIEIHALGCPVKAAVEEIKNRRRGSLATWGLIFSILTLAGTLLLVFKK